MFLKFILLGFLVRDLGRDFGGGCFQSFLFRVLEKFWEGWMLVGGVLQIRFVEIVLVRESLCLLCYQEGKGIQSIFWGYIQSQINFRYFYMKLLLVNQQLDIYGNEQQIFLFFFLKVRIVECLLIVLFCFLLRFMLFQVSNGQWYQMNDFLVYFSNIKVVLNQQVYVFFYLR